MEFEFFGFGALSLRLSSAHAWRDAVSRFRAHWLLTLEDKSLMNLKALPWTPESWNAVLGEFEPRGPSSNSGFLATCWWGSWLRLRLQMLFVRSSNSIARIATCSLVLEGKVPQ